MMMIIMSKRPTSNEGQITMWMCAGGNLGGQSPPAKFGPGKNTIFTDVADRYWVSYW